MEKWKLWVWIFVSLWSLGEPHATTSLVRDQTHHPQPHSVVQEKNALLLMISTEDSNDDEYGYYYYYYGYYDDAESANDDGSSGNENDDNGMVYLQTARPSRRPTRAPTKVTMSPTVAPFGPTLHPTRRPSGPTPSPTGTSSPTLSPSKFTSSKPTPGKPTLRPTTNAPSLQPSHSSLFEVQQFSSVADPVVISMMTITVFLWLGLVAFHLCRYYDYDPKTSVSALILWTTEQLDRLRNGNIDSTAADGDKKRKKRTLRKAQGLGSHLHEDYWTEESEERDQRKNFPLRSANANGGVTSLDTSLGSSVNSNTSMLYSVNLDDHNWDESVRGGGGGGGGGAGMGAGEGAGGEIDDIEEFYSVHSQSGISLINRNI